MTNAAALILSMFKGQLHTRQRFARSSLHPSKDHITHRPTAKLLGTRLTQHPANRVNHVRLTTAIRPDNGGDVMLKGKSGGIGKGFKAGEF